MTADFFKYGFKTLTGHMPMRWQARLLSEHFANGKLPSAVSIPTGLGKTAVMAIWLVALAAQMKEGKPSLPRRLVYVVDRRAVVDQATRFAEDLRSNLGKPEAKEVATALGLSEGENLPISTLRGQFVDNREWLNDPDKPAIIVGTVDMIGSRLLFEGYGVSRKMRPYHAGLLGADALVLLDEAHLVPPFEALLAEIVGNTGRYGAKQADLNALVPRFQLLPLSATGRRQTNTPFALQEKDFRDSGTVVDEETDRRLHAKKHLTLLPLDDKRLEDALAEKAWALAQDDEKRLKPIRVIVYCDKRDVATEVERKLKDKAKQNADTELFVGARRVRERQEAQERLQTMGFLAGGTKERNQPAFLVATSAGEVGVDLDADHMVCDLVAWERMVQRFGRVNRRGEGDATIIVVDAGEPVLKKADQPTTEESERLGIYRAVKQMLEQLDSIDKGRDVSPNALRILTTKDRLRETLLASTTPAPLRPALNRALLDSWAMTSLPEHTGRPEIAPWLRGWVNELPQTTVAWRRHLPIRAKPPASKKEIEDFFEAAPLHVSETLETETYRVMKWLQARAAKHDQIPDDENVLKMDDVVAMLLKIDGSLARTLKLSDLLGDSKDKDDKKLLEDIERDLNGKTLVMDARFGGLRSGLLADDSADEPTTADDGTEWMESTNGKPVIRFRVFEHSGGDIEPLEDGWRESVRFDLERGADGEATRWLSVEKWRDTSNTEDDRAEGRPQLLDEHQSWTAERAAAIGKNLGLPDDYVCALCIAARLHDEGKRAKRWQRAFRAERDAAKLGKTSQPLAKTRGPINQAVLGGYRHEFGSLPEAQKDVDFQKLREKNPDLAELVLHLIAAHHGFARPLIATEGCEDAPPSVLEERAREVALRYARLQKRWGPWGLAWWESLLRAADAQASRANDERSD